MFALMLKELRSILRFVALALLADGWLLNEMTGPSFTGGVSVGLPLVHSGWLGCFGFLLACIASVLGLAMSLDDGLRGTWGFALFRPVSRRAYIGAKLVVGGATTFVLAVLPVVIYSVWAMTPGKVMSPFHLSQLQPGIEACGWSVVVFLGAFLSGIRPAKWWWSRLWPLAATLVLGAWFWLTTIEPNFPLAIIPSTAGYWSLCVATSAGLVVSIMAVVEERDFA